MEMPRNTNDNDDNVDDLNDDEYAKLIDVHIFDININNIVHNIYIDHVDKHDNDSGYHHHHRTNRLDDLDIIHHHDDECDNDHDTPITIHYDFGSSYVVYGPAKHNHTASVHDDHDRVGVAEHRIG